MRVLCCQGCTLTPWTHQLLQCPTPDIVPKWKENLSNEILDCEQSPFSSEIRGEERKTSKCANVTVSVTVSLTCERRY